MSTDWRDRARLWDRFAAAPPAQQALLRLMYQAGLEDGSQVAWLDAAQDGTIELIVSGTLVALDRRDRRRLSDAGVLGLDGSRDPAQDLTP